MIGIFKQKASTNALLLFVYALVLKFPLFLHPFSPVLHAEDNYLYRFILTGLNSLFGHAALPFAILSFILLFSQATLLNSICNYHKMLPRANYLPAHVLYPGHFTVAGLGTFFRSLADQFDCDLVPGTGWLLYTIALHRYPPFLISVYSLD